MNVRNYFHLMILTGICPELKQEPESLQLMVESRLKVKTPAS